VRERIMEREQFIPASIEAVCARFADVENLEAITPPWLHFEILSEKPVVMATGTIIDHRLRLHGIPIRWRTLIDRWDPPHGFTDSQQRGPYATWIHTHSFTAVDGGTLARDHVRYRVGYGPIGNLALRLFVARDIERIFDFRRDAIHRLLTGPAS
jgi:ligand-binding SRPBCC domain-containing protein